MTSGDPVAPATNPVDGRSVLVTGGSGAFGKAFTRRCLDLGARRVVVFSRGESAQAAMKVAFPDDRMRWVIGDVRDGHRLCVAMRDVDIVVHAAALKRVETCEADPDEAVATNIRGTQLVAHACIEAGVERAVFLSTDKAAAPNTLYGMTKATAERLWIGSNVYSAGTATRFSATRYGNVLASTGSVIPTWRAEAEHGRPITVTAPTMGRFWMPMSAAVDLVLYALEHMCGGEIFVPKIGASTIADLAVAVAPNAEWRITGPRPGEKWHETLVTGEEARHTYDAGSVLIIEPEGRSWGVVDPLPFPLVPQGFAYTTENPEIALGADGVRQLLEAA